MVVSVLKLDANNPDVKKITVVVYINTYNYYAIAAVNFICTLSRAVQFNN